MQAAHIPRQNHLLTALPAADFQRLQPYLTLVALSSGEVLYEAGSHSGHAYFPTTSVISKLHVTADGASTEIAVVGNDGMIGFSLLMSDSTSLNQAVVQSDGYAYRVASVMLQKEFARGEALRRLLLLYTQALMTQMAQTAVCNRLHSIDQQLCRSLLMSLDRLTSNEFATTQESIAHRLGVRREGVTAAAGKLQRAGLIHHSRGYISVLNRAGVEARACECYAVVKKECERLLPDRLERVEPRAPVTKAYAARRISTRRTCFSY
jgi:CRP-like cAMP-binding protein